MSQAIQHLAQLNIGRVRHALDDSRMADFMNNLGRVNALAEGSPGFVWRYSDASGNATDTRPFADDPRMMINMSVWESVEALETFVWQTVHRRFYARKHEWFEKLEGAYFVLWHVAAGHRPGVEEALARLDHLKTHGPSDYAFGWHEWRPRNWGDRRAVLKARRCRNGMIA